MVLICSNFIYFKMLIYLSIFYIGAVLSLNVSINKIIFEYLQNNE